MFQSTPLCKGRHIIMTEAISFVVSIHAPMQGATRERKPILLRNIVSIHAPMQGATP